MAELNRVRKLPVPPLDGHQLSPVQSQRVDVAGSAVAEQKGPVVGIKAEPEAESASGLKTRQIDDTKVPRTQEHDKSHTVPFCSAHTSIAIHWKFLNHNYMYIHLSFI
jgi:hypothetical protein